MYREQMAHWEANGEKAEESAVRNARFNIGNNVKVTQQAVVDARKNYENADKDWQLATKKAAMAANRDILQAAQSDAFKARLADKKFAEQHKKFMENIAKENVRLRSQSNQISQQKANIMQKNYDLADVREDLAEDKFDFQKQEQPIKDAYMQSGMELNATRAAESRAKNLASDADMYKYPKARYAGEPATEALFRHYAMSETNPEELRKKIVDNGYSIRE
jgi:hypothetical protein